VKPIILPDMDDLRRVLQRIEKRLKALDLTANAVSRAAGKPDAIRNLRRAVKDGGRTGVSTATVAALAPVLKTSAAWLTEQIGPEDPAAATAPLADVRVVPLVSWVSAGKLADANSQIPVEDLPLFAFADLGRGDFFALRVVGDSMDRISPEDSIIIIDRDDQKPVPGKYYVFSVRGETTYKQWNADPECLLPLSTNASHKPFFIKRKKDLEVVGRVRRTVLDL
jgi:SOS-response transcriptional repressor LexA